MHDRFGLRDISIWPTISSLLDAAERFSTHDLSTDERYGRFLQQPDGAAACLTPRARYQSRLEKLSSKQGCKALDVPLVCLGSRSSWVCLARVPTLRMPVQYGRRGSAQNAWPPSSRTRSRACCRTFGESNEPTTCAKHPQEYVSSHLSRLSVTLAKLTARADVAKAYGAAVESSH